MPMPMRPRSQDRPKKQDDAKPKRKRSGVAPKPPTVATRRRQEMVDFWNSGGGHRLRRLRSLLEANEADSTIEDSFATAGPDCLALGKEILRRQDLLPPRKVGRKL